MIQKVFAALVVAMVFGAAPAVAETAGAYGNVWGIAEKDGVEALKDLMRQKEKDGSARRMWEDARQKTVEGMENPKPLPGISAAKEHRVWTFDPTFTFPQTVRDHLGNILVPSGTKINPLDHQGLSKAYVFIDAREPAQVEFAKKYLDANPKNKIVLTAGPVLALARKWEQPVYFDQKGVLTNHFGIKRVPAVLTQSGRVLKVEEFPL